MYGLVRFFQMGGFFMFPILLTLAAGIAIAALGIMIDRIARYAAARYGR